LYARKRWFAGEQYEEMIFARLDVIIALF